MACRTQDLTLEVHYSMLYEQASGSRSSSEETPPSTRNSTALRNAIRDGWLQNRNDIQFSQYEEAEKLRFLDRNETVAPWGQRPNKAQ